MVSMAATGENVQYARPPVRMTVFTVYIKPLDLDVNLVTQLRDKWADGYPGLKQSPPKYRPGGLLPQTDPFSASWPMPALHLANSSLSRTLPSSSISSL
ncbi:hypothetical protein LAUMK142_05394 [Mycobacterium pseudokansasii]|uniref:Uncharacterized protein n=1 Tax=Mycobacterium pseudokansasii TaxID=2341080 RepID=A0A498R4V8_9MYCO|nr:hypothetical protein LAUMK142_05394 [Mycobacterium pseudokansasii]